MLCFPISNHSTNFLKRQSEKFRDLKFPDTSREKDIVLLIGSDLYWKFVKGKFVKSGTPESLVAIEKKCG